MFSCDWPTFRQSNKPTIRSYTYHPFRPYNNTTIIQLHNVLLRLTNSPAIQQTKQPVNWPNILSDHTIIGQYYNTTVFSYDWSTFRQSNKPTIPSYTYTSLRPYDNTTILQFLNFLIRLTNSPAFQQTNNPFIYLTSSPTIRQYDNTTILQCSHTTGQHSGWLGWWWW